ncbi:MAG: polyphosphate polymerase domain-containing protein [Clostridium sp.]
MRIIDLEAIRNEKKYKIDEVTKFRLIDTLEKIMERDKFNENGKYKVRSLYFDTIYNKDYLEKKNGILERRKIRLRTYDEESDLVKLEIKEKINEVQKKQSIVIKKNVAIKLMNGQYDVLRLIKGELAEKLYYIMRLEMYRPTCIIEYTRSAYELKENKTRITVDENIRATESNLDLFSKDLMLNKVIEDTVLEVKYDRFLVSYIKDILDRINKLDISCSKYCEGRILEWI